MLLTICALAGLALPPATLAPGSAPSTAGDHGKLEWFSGTWDQLMAQAASQNKMVFIDFWTDWCGWCKKLDKDTFSNDDVAARMKGVLCYSVDAESEMGAPLAEKFAVNGYPALLLVAPNGEPLDKIGGYLAPDDFLQAIERVARGEGTLPSMRQQVEADPKNIELRYAYATKSRDLGLVAVFDEQMSAIRSLDPEGQSLTSRRIAFEVALAPLQSKLDTLPMLAFLQEEKHAELLIDGWIWMARAEDYLRDKALKDGDRAGSDQHAKKLIEYLGYQWKNVPADQPPAVVKYGNAIAWQCYEMREQLGSTELAWALGLAHKAVEASNKKDASVLDTLGCLMFVTGDKAGAIATLELCVQLEPENDAWKERLEEFKTEV